MSEEKVEESVESEDNESYDSDVNVDYEQNYDNNEPSDTADFIKLIADNIIQMVKYKKNKNIIERENEAMIQLKLHKDLVFMFSNAIEYSRKKPFYFE